MTKGRFAPSPTGRMHLGNVYSALLAWLSARSHDGKWLLRIEDIDPQRSKQEYADLLMEDLEWLGLTWDEGPFYQSQREEIYEEYLSKLKALDAPVGSSAKTMGMVYPCYCTRADILATQAPHESDGRVVYKGTCRYKPLPPEPVPAAMRLIVPDKEISFIDGHYGEQHVNLATHCGDFIVRRKDGAWAYQLAVVVDDALMGVTEVVRGRDLLLSSPQQIYLAEILGFKAPSYIHLPLLCSASKEEGGTREVIRRLSKRDKSLDMGVLRQHYSHEEIIGRLAFYAGIIPEPMPIKAENLIPLFEWNKVPLDDIIV